MTNLTLTTSNAKLDATHFVERTDDRGTEVLVEGSLHSCIAYVCSCFPEIDATKFASTWRAWASLSTLCIGRR